MTPEPAGPSCAQCGRVVPKHSLVYDGSARIICTRCEADVVSGGIAKSNMLRLTLGPLGLALIGTFTFCLPVLSIFLPVVFGVLALLGGLAAIRTGLGGDADEGATRTAQPILIVSGIVAGLWGVVLVGVNVLVWLGFALR